MFDERLKSLFLRELSEYPNITVAARAVGVSPATIYKHKKDDPLFAERMQEALDESVDMLEHEVHRRAFQGVDKPVFFQGRECGAIREYSDGLAMFLLKAHRPNKYRERSNVELTGQDGGPVEITDRQRAARIAAILTAAQKRKEQEIADGYDLV